MTELALTRVKARRRRLPRPPKLTTWQKFVMFCGFVTALSAMQEFVIAPAITPLLLLLGGTSVMHGTYCDALRPPFGGFQSNLLGIAALAAGLTMEWVL